MKKIVTIIVVLIISWLAFLYYANATTEDNIQSYTAKMNAMYKEMDLGVTLEISEYQSDFFGAMVQYSITINPQKLLKIATPDIAILMGAGSKHSDISNIFKKPFTISQHIAYGPLFFDNGIEFGRAKSIYKATLTDTLTAIIYKINTQVDKDNALRISDKKMEKLKAEIDSVLKKEVYVEYSSILALFSDDNTVVAKISEIAIEEAEQKLLIQPITLNSTYNLNDFTGDLQLHIPQVLATKQGVEKLYIKNLTLNYDINEFINMFEYFGSVNIYAENIKFNLSKNQGDIALKVGIATDIEKGIAQNFSNIKTRITADMLEYPNNKPPFDLPKNIELTIDILEFNIAQFSKTMQELEDRIYADIIAMQTNNDTQEFQRFIQQDFISYIQRIVSKDNTKLNIGLSVVTEQLSTITNTIRLNTTYTLSDDKLHELLNTSIAQKERLLSLIKKALEVELDIKFAKKLAEKFEPFLVTPRKMQLIVEDGHMLTTNIIYKQDKVYINGKENEMINQQLQVLVNMAK